MYSKQQDARIETVYNRIKFDLRFFFSVALRANAGHGLHILEVFRSHTMKHYSR